MKEEKSSGFGIVVGGVLLALFVVLVLEGLYFLAAVLMAARGLG